MSVLIADRYRVEESLGVGGMGAVQRVVDERTSRVLALKQLRVATQDQALLRAQFEREYHVLVQLRHPSIIEVYDYGVDERGDPYYTMELLDGQDLRERPAPDFREACALLRDVASSLAVLHSRRLLHRDITPRNIRCTSNGHAKLIDFGAMAPMGVLKNVVGTPPFVPPEAVQLQALDGRADLFALGAVFYWVMTRRHAYPARNFAELTQLWRTPIASPRQYDAQLPPALDELIMQLLQLDRNARPASAAEVMDRLCGIAGLAREERPAVFAAYLTTPSLVGRDEVLQQLRARLADAQHGGASTLLFEGESGSGRSRALDAAVLDAKLAGAVVVRADTADAASGPYGVARSLATQLLVALPDLARRCAAPHRDALAHVLPELQTLEIGDALSQAPVWHAGESMRSSLPGAALPASVIPAGASPHSLPALPSRPAPAQSVVPAATPERRTIQTALRDFILAIARARLLVLAVDDVDAIDEPSAALLATLAHAAKRRKLVVLLAARDAVSAPGSALAVLRQVAQRHALAALAPAQTEALLRSVFGDVPNVAAVSESVHRIASGNPRWTLELAQHLVNRGVARYEAGSWALPPLVAAADIPASLSESISARLAELPADARELAEALALTEAALVRVDAYPELTAHGDRARAFHALSDLVASGILVEAGSGYRFKQDEVAAALREPLTPEQRTRVHARIARVLSPAEHPLQVAEHQLLGGMAREGLGAVLAASMDQSRPQSPLQMRRLIELALDHADRSDAPARLRVVLRCRLLFTCAVLGDYARFCALLPGIKQCVMQHSGLADYHALAQIADPLQRAAEAVARARARHVAAPERERVFAPEEACVWLSHMYSSCAYMAAVAWDLGCVEDLPAATPLLPFSPALRNVDRIVDGQRAMQSGRASVAAAHAEVLMRQVDEPEFANLSAAERALRREPFVYTLGIYDAVGGKPSALDYVKELEQSQHRSNAWRLRMVYELMHGRSEAAAECQRRAELVALQDGGKVTLPGTTMRIELLAGIYADDFIAVKRSMERIEGLAAIYPGWKPALAIARAHYLRLQGDLPGALVQADLAVELAPAGRHLNWSIAATTQLDVLCAMGNAERAATLGEAHLQTAVQLDIDSARTPLLRSVAEACVRAGRSQEAKTMADEHLQRLLDFGTQGLQLGLAYETRARVAIAMHDEPAVHHYAALCAEAYKGGRNNLLGRRYQQLMQAADQAGVPLETLQRQAADFSAFSVASAAQTLHSRMLSALSEHERAEQALRLLIEVHGAIAGHLFGTRDGQLEQLASTTAAPPSVELVRALQAAASELSQSLAVVPEQVAVPEATRMEASFEEGATAFDAGHDRAPGGALEATVDGFEPLPLVVRRGGARTLAGVVALRFEGPARRAVPGEVLSAFADALLNREPA